MQLASRAPAAPKKSRMGRPNMASLGRSLRYLSRYPRLTFGATLSLIIATAAQLVVPQLVQRIGIGDLPPNSTPELHGLIEFASPAGDKFTGMVRELDATAVLVDFNHPLAGHRVCFEVQIIAVL